MTESIAHAPLAGVIRAGAARLESFEPPHARRLYLTRASLALAKVRPSPSRQRAR